MPDPRRDADIYPAPRLRCVECGLTGAGRAEGWRSVLAGGVDEEPEEAGVYCPQCYRRECRSP